MSAVISAIPWPAVIAQAVEIVRSYDTSVTLRQLFYRLVSVQLLPNTTGAYKNLSRITAEGRRQGTFPELIDRGRQIYVYATWHSAKDAVEDAKQCFRLDRTTGQSASIYLGVEKAGLVIQLQSWFGDLGIPVLALGGYSSQSYIDEVKRDVKRRSRPAVLLYAGDFDPSGEDIDRDFIERTGCWAEIKRVALTSELVREYELPINPGKDTDTRAAGFVARHGSLMQVEIDALDPTDLRRLFQAAVDKHWDGDAYGQVMEEERKQDKRLASLVRRLK